MMEVNMSYTCTVPIKAYVAPIIDRKGDRAMCVISWSVADLNSGEILPEEDAKMANAKTQQGQTTRSCPLECRRATDHE